MEIAKLLKAHEIVLSGTSGNQEFGDCPFCGKEGRFYLNMENGGWDCKRCKKHGFQEQLLKEICAHNETRMDEERWAILEKDRGIDRETLKAWKVGWNGRKYTIPIFNPDGTCVDARLFKPGLKSMATPGASLGLLGGPILKKQRKVPVYLCEGEWDGLAMAMLASKLGKDIDVVAVPGANVFKKHWIPWFEGRDVVVAYDQDEAGEDGERIVREKLTGTARSIRYVRWPDAAPAGFDLRDWVRYGLKLKDAKGCWETLNTLLQKTPRKLTPDEKATPQDPGGEAETPLAPTDGTINAAEAWAIYSKWLHLESDDVLSVIFGTVFANRLQGEPIWLFIVDPPGGGKSELLMSMSEHKEVYATTSLTPHTLISGATWSNGKDPSLIPQLDKKILIIKDFTTIISMHYTQSQEICGTLRDAYDGQTARNFGTGIRRSYKSKFGILAGVTDKIETFSTLNASLGERFLRFRLAGHRRESEEDKILKALSNISQRLEMRQALVGAANRVLNRESPTAPPEVSHAFLKRVVKLAQFTAVLRGVVDRDRFRDTVNYRPSHEVGTRLAMQLTKLGMGIAIYKERPGIGEDEFRIMKKIALDTVPDRFQVIVKRMWNNPRMLRTQEVSELTRLPQATVFRLLQDMDLLQIVDRQSDGSKHNWRLHPRLTALIDEGGIYAAPPPKAEPPAGGSKLRMGARRTGA